MIAAGVGVGKGDDAFAAGQSAVEQAIAELPKKKADILLVFGSSKFDQAKLLRGVTKAASGVPFVGCSTAGELSSEGFFTEESVVVMALASEKLAFSLGLGKGIAADPLKAGLECVKTLRHASPTTNSGLLFLDVVSGEGDTAVRSLRNELGHNYPIWGGAGGDDLAFQKTFQYMNGVVLSDAIVGLGISGAHHAVGVAMHGFLPVGRAWLVTKTSGRTLQGLDGKRASAIYEEYFGPEYFKELKTGALPALAVAYPLGILPPNSDEVLLRDPISFSDDGAITFTSPVPFGTPTRLMISDTARGLETVERAASEVARLLDGRKPKAVLVIDSVTRKRMIGRRNDEEIEIIQRVLGRDVPIAGYYGYAEIDGGKVGDASFHNGSVLIWALAE